jgi:kumamolisin
MTHAYAVLPIPGSRRHPLAGARRVGDADPDAVVTVTMVLRRESDEPGSPASEADIAAVRSYADRTGLEIVAVHRASRSVRLRGTAAAMNDAFSVALGHFETTDGQVFRGRTGSIHVPVALDGVVVAVLGLDNRAQASTHFRVLSGIEARANAVGRTPPEIAAAYAFPTGVEGTGQTVAIIELGGGYQQSDLDTYFAQLGLPVPAVEAIGVDGATNSPGGDADGEVMLDIEVIGAIAPGARLAVYFGPNTDDGFYDAIAAAVHDTARTPSVISISWGQAESGWTASAMDAYEALFADAAAAGISVYAAAGDNGASDGVPGGGLHVDFPASAPSVVGCGGTTLPLHGDEVVWNEMSTGEGATGGGYSVHFTRPAYQDGAGLAAGEGRGVPDVAGNADPSTGYRVRFDGADQVIGGTSAVAPLWSALTVLANQGNGTNAGAPQARLYASGSAFRDIVLGDNDGYSAAVGWDPCTGMGVPIGTDIATALAP